MNYETFIFVIIFVKNFPTIVHAFPINFIINQTNYKSFTISIDALLFSIM